MRLNAGFHEQQERMWSTGVTRGWIFFVYARFSCAFVYTCVSSATSMCHCVLVFTGLWAGWAPLRQPPHAAEGLGRRRRCWKMEPIYLRMTNVSAFVSFSHRIRRKSHESCVLRESERELDQIKGNTGAGLQPIPTREGKKDGIWKLQFKEMPHRWCLEEKTVGGPGGGWWGWAQEVVMQ